MRIIAILITALFVLVSCNKLKPSEDKKVEEAVQKIDSVARDVKKSTEELDKSIKEVKKAVEELND